MYYTIWDFDIKSPNASDTIEPLMMLNRDSPARRYLTGPGFPLYLFHQTLTIVFARHLLPSKLAPFPEGFLLVAMTTVFGFVSYEIGRRVRYLRTLIGARDGGQ